MSETQGKKFDQNKPRMSLLPKGALNAVIRVLEFGAKKYTVIDLHDKIIIGKTIEERLWSSMRNVSSAEGTKESSLKVAVQNATVRSTIRYLHALAVEKKNLSQQKMENVVLATSLSDLPSVLWSLKLDKNINKLTEAHLSSENKNANVIANGVAIPNAENNDSEILNNETLRDTDLPYKSMNIFVSEGALSAEVQNVHTLTTTITQGSSVTSFAVSAIKLLDCYKTLLILLEHYYSISINISELGEVKRGADNWKHVPDAKTRYYDAMQRHIEAWWQGEQKDPETGEHHLAHAICCGMFLMWFDDVADNTNIEKLVSQLCKVGGEVMRSEFENSIKRSASYEKLVYQHGERLFIFEDGQYKIAAVQLAWEIFKEKQTDVDELKLQVAEMKSRLNDAYTDGQSAMYAARQTKVDELQKRVDALTNALDKIAYPIQHMQKEAEINGFELNGYWAVKMSEDHTYSKDIARKALEKEQALKGGLDD